MYFGAVQRSALCRSRRKLSNEYFLAKFGFDTTENEPSKVFPIVRRVRRADGGTAVLPAVRWADGLPPPLGESVDSKMQKTRGATRGGGKGRRTQRRQEEEMDNEKEQNVITSHYH